VCIVDAQGKILKKAKVASEPEALIAWLAAHGAPMARLTTRKLLQAKRHDVEMSLRGVRRGFGLKVGPTTPRRRPRPLRAGCGISWLIMTRCRRLPMCS
jgi:hypothetical protein